MYKRDEKNEKMFYYNFLLYSLSFHVNVTYARLQSPIGDRL